MIRFGYISEIENKHIENFNDDAWMEQHMGMRKKWRKCVVFGTPLHPKVASDKQAKNSYFRNLQTEKFWIIVVSVEGQDTSTEK